MQEAAVERLTKILSDGLKQNDDSGDKESQSRKPVLEMRLGLAEGWFSLFLVAAVVYSTIWCVQAVGWVDHLEVLTLTTALGLVSGVIAAKQKRLPRFLEHSLAVVLGLLLAFWQTSNAFDGGSSARLLDSMHNWVVTVINGGTVNDDSIFLFFIVALGFMLAYASAWLVYRTRSPWLMIVANAVILLINLNNVDDSYIFFLIVFLVASLFLLLRFNLYESTWRWRQQGLRYADDIGWDIMQTGALISIGILIFSWCLPSNYTDATASQIWNANSWVQIQDTLNRVISVSGGTTPANHGNFRDTLVLGGNPNLNHDIVLTVRTSDSSAQYLMSLNYSTYTDQGWTNGPVQNQPVPANLLMPNGAAANHSVTQNITIVNPPGEQNAYILGASDIAEVSQPAQEMRLTANGTVVSWLAQNGRLAAGSSYTVTSLVSSADVDTLRLVPTPNDAPQFPADFDGPIPPTYFDQATLQTNTQLPNDLDPNIARLAKDITANAPTMYDKVVAIETYLREHYSYDLNVQLPPGQEGVSWFLFRSGNRGFCNYFSTTMAVMLRTLGIPARVAAGYTSGEDDVKNHQYVIRGTDAHSWTQVYFAGYGWINFEPSASFNTFSRPLPNQFPNNGVGGSSVNSPGGSITPPKLLNKHNLNGDNGPDTTSGNATAGSQTQLPQRVGLTLGSIVLLALFAGILLFSLWWRRLFHRYDLSTQLYGRLCMLASWAGIEIQPSQTPYEYIQGLAKTTPKEAPTLERLGDIYVRDRWADPESMEHPHRSGETSELPSLWKRLQPRLFFYVLRHPYFLQKLPPRIWNFLSSQWKRRRVKELLQEDF